MSKSNMYPRMPFLEGRGLLPPVRGSDPDTKLTTGFYIPGANAGKPKHRALVRWDRNAHPGEELHAKICEVFEEEVGECSWTRGMSSDGRDIEGFMIVEFKDVEKADDMATDAAWRLKRDRVLKERVLIRTCHLEYRDEDTVEYKMDEKGHLVVSVATPAAKPGEKPSSVTTFGFAPPDPFEWPPK